ncbi:MAG: MFS transporter [Alphaproteobacteria bacterium]|jgi:MFS family permease|nr:MFS transporter [Alphaproteobacteria bacterium]
MEKNYKLFFIAYVIANVGDWFFKLAMPIYLFEKTGSALYMAVGYALSFLPFLLFTLVGGILADIYARKYLIVIIMFLSAAVVGIISYVIHIDGGLALIFVLSFTISSLSTIGHPILQSYIVDIVQDKAKLASRNSFLLSVDNTLVLVAPILSGVLISVVGAKLCFVVNAAALLVATLFIMLIDVKGVNVKISKNIKSITNMLKEGFITIKAQPFLLYGSILFFGTNFSTNFFNVNFVYILKEYLLANPTQVGICFAITGIGALAGSFFAPQFLKKFSEGRLIVIMTVFAGIFMFALMLADNYILLGAIWGLVSFFGAVNVVAFFTLRQKVVPSEILGRSVAITRMISYASIPLAAILGGMTLNATNNVILIIVIAASVRILMGILAIFTPLFKSHAKI